MNDITRIAIVDDHLMFRKGLASLINLFPNTMVILDAGDGQELIEQINSESLPDIVLLDITMPVMDGYETAQWLRKHYPEIRILALSTMDNETAIIRMIKYGVKGYILKDANPDELKNAFAEVLSQGYFFNELISRKVISAVNKMADTKNEINLWVNLNDREIQFLKFVCTDLTYKEIAEKMNLSVRTVEGYRDALCEKFNVKSRVGLAVYAMKNQIVKV